MSLTSSLDKNINGNFEWRVNGNISNTVPIKDVNQNPLSFEYGYSKFNPGIQVKLVFKCISSQGTNNTGTVRTVLIVTDLNSITNDISQSQLSGSDISKIKALSKKKSSFWNFS